MELEEMKSLWKDLSGKIENQDKIKKEKLMEMTRKNYRNSLGTIYLPEILGSVICFLYSAFFIFQVEKLELQVNQVLAIFNSAVMIVLPIISLVTLYRLNKLNIIQESPVQLLAKFKKGKTFFWKFQRFNLIFSGFFAISILPPLADLVGKDDLILELQFWMIYVPLGLIFIYLFGRMTFKKYEKALRNAEQMLEGIE